jgi:Carboxypeptidase regulatory-like domain
MRIGHAENAKTRVDPLLKHWVPSGQMQVTIRGYMRLFHLRGHKANLRSAILGIVIMGSLVSWSQLPCHAQQITGTLFGTVQDSGNAAVPGAAVKATNIDTGVSHAVTSNSQGEYRIEYLAVGNYVIEVKAPSFETFVQKNVSLTVDQSQRVDVTLAVGVQSQTVTVTTAPALVDTTTAELGRTVQPAEIIGLPLVNRNVYTEISLTPGVQSNSASASNNTPNFQIGVPSTQVVINGGIDGGVPMVSYYLDGGINMTGLRNYGNPLPNPDALQEFRVETSDFSAQYGRMSGAVVTAVTRSGTNQFHGSLFEFLRNTDLNATPWNATLKAPYHRNQFGGTVGGPVLRDKAFFFFSYGGLRQTTGSFLSGGVVPTALERQGNFSQSKVLPVDPTTGQPYVYNGTPGWIPPTDLDPTAQNIISKYIPLSNSANNAWTGYFSAPTNDDEYLAKYDQTLSAKDHLAVSYFNLKTTQDAYGGGNIPWSINESFARQQNANISDIHTLSPTTANQAWFTFTRVAGGRVNLPTTSIADLGSSFSLQGPPSLPEITVSGYFTAGGALAGPVSNTDFYSLRDMISTTRGKHSFVYGAEISLEKDIFAGNLDNFGVFSFSTTTPGSTKNALADFDTGKVGSMEQDTPYHGLLSNWYYAFFLQDNYRVLRRLTLNLGLRYDLELAPVESSNLTSTFVPGVQSTVVRSAPLGLLYPGDKGVTRGIVDARKHHISPRVGIVWDPFGDGKTAIRAGAGVFYGSVSANMWNQPANAQPFAVRQVFSSIESLTNVYGNPASFPTGSPFPYHYSPANPRFLPAASVETIAKNYQWPLVYQLNTAVERQLPGQVSVVAAYVGTLSHDLPFSTDANYPAYAAGASTSQASINARRPYDPGVLGQVWYIESNQTASYHSLQISARRQLTRNLMLTGFYVLSKSFWSAQPSGTGLSNAQDYDALYEERGPSDLDARNSASISGIWNLNYYRGSSFLLKQVANGWSISSIVAMNSGTPVNILTGANRNFDTYGNNRPNLVPGNNAFLNPHRSRPAAAAEWFNSAAFTPNGPGLGIGIGAADGTTPRDYLRAPGYRDIDLGIFRDIAFERGITLQVRAEATNAFNLVSLSAPTANLASSLNGKITSAASPRLIQVGARLTF